MYRDNNLFSQLYRAAPIPLEWGGWRTDTFSLNRMGWEINGEEHDDEYTDSKIISIGVVDPEKRIMMRGRYHLPRYRVNSISDAFEEITHRGLQMQMHSVKDKIMPMAQMEIKSLHAMQPIDLFEPTHASMREIHMGQFEFFKYKQTKEIYIPPESVSECLDRILQLQYPEQQEIKKKLVMTEAKPLIQARILTLAS